MSDTVFVVMNGDGDNDFIAAVYATKELADSDVAERGGWVCEEAILGALHADVTDSAKMAERAAEHERWRATIQRGNAEQERRAEFYRTVQPHNGNLGVCHCPAWGGGGMLTPSGYCKFCGNWNMNIVLKQCGRDYVVNEIGRLAEHHRQKMMELLNA